MKLHLMYPRGTCFFSVLIGQIRSYDASSADKGRTNESKLGWTDKAVVEIVGQSKTHGHL